MWMGLPQLLLPLVPKLTHKIDPLSGELRFLIFAVSCFMERQHRVLITPGHS